VSSIFQSLLSSPLGNAKGVKELVIRTVSNQAETHFGFPLRLLAETSQGALDLLLARRPEMILIYAKVAANQKRLRITQSISFTNQLNPVLHNL